MAAPSEYGANLRTAIDPLMIGVGPVEAAVNLTAYLGGLAALQRLPDLMVSLGSVGSRRLPQAEIFQVSAISYRDMDVSVLGFERGRNPLLDLPAVVELPYAVSGLPSASLSTGGNMVSGHAYDRIDADMVDMRSSSSMARAGMSPARWRSQKASRRSSYPRIPPNCIPPSVSGP